MSALKKNLNKLGLDETQLSRRELETLTKIQEYYTAYETKNESLKKELQNNKFNRNVIKDAGICSRQTLYTNEIINNFMQLLELQADNVCDANKAKYISRDKYNELKEENALLISNAVDVAIKDAEIERLTRENKQLHNRINTLVKRIETNYTHSQKEKTMS